MGNSTSYPTTSTYISGPFSDTDLHFMKKHPLHTMGCVNPAI
jgi:hypothetical protein